MPRGPAAVEPAGLVSGEVVSIEEPATKRLILTGRVALAALGVDPDDWVSPETEAEARTARSLSTGELLLWAYGALIQFTGPTGRRHDPPTSGTMREWVKAHWEMTRAADAGRVKRGRAGQPYSPSTVELRVYLIAMICNRLQWVNPCRDPKVHEQVLAYRLKFEQAGYKTFEADPMTPALSVRLAREGCDLGTVNGLRNALAYRLQFDTGCRATEMVEGLRIEDLKWVDEYKVGITFRKVKNRSRGAKPRTVWVQGIPTIPHPDDFELPLEERRQIPNPEWDVDPVHLLLLWLAVLRQFGITAGPLFREVTNAAQRRKDWEASGVYAGRVLEDPWTRGSYQMCWDRAVAKTGIAFGPQGTRFRFTTHSNRAGMITKAVEAGIPLVVVANRTGHNPTSESITKYYRSDRLWDDDNIGVAIRTRAAEEAAAEARKKKRRSRKKPE